MHHLGRERNPAHGQRQRGVPASGGGPRRRRIRRTLTGWLAALLFSLPLGLLQSAWLAPPAQASPLATGHLRVAAEQDGFLELRQASGWQVAFEIQRGLTTLWDLPCGTYAIEFQPAGRPGAEAPDEASTQQVLIWEGLTTRIEISPQQASVTVRSQPDDAQGSLFRLSPALWAALPGSKEQLLQALDTTTLYHREALVS